VSRRIIQDELTDFRIWMRATDRCTPSTANEYTSHVRRAYRELGGNVEDVEAVNTYFAHAYKTDTSYPKLRSAWIVYVEWCMVEKGQTIPSPVPVSLVRAKEKSREVMDAKLPGLPEHIRTALRVLQHNVITMNHVFNLRWVDVALREMTRSQITHVSVPGRRHESWVVPSETMQVLWDWADVGNNLSHPLVPRAPGESQPYPHSGLRREVGIYTEKELQAIQDSPGGDKTQELLRELKENQLKRRKEAETVASLSPSDLLSLLTAPRLLVVKNDFRLASSLDDGTEEEALPEEKEKAPSLDKLLGFDPDAD